MAYEILTLVTNTAKSRFITGLINGYAIQVTHFAVGNQGHDPDSPISALTPDPGLNPTPDVSGNSLPPDMTFGPKAVASATIGADFCPIWSGALEKGEATGEISSYYLLAKYVYPNPAYLNGVDGAANPDEASHALYGLYDKLWIFSYAYTPLAVKTDNAAFDPISLGVQF